jgi:putative chitinase
VQNQRFIEQGDIDTPLRLCHFLAQLAHESAHFGTTREFASGDAYEGRRDLGNIQPGDGPRYRGRGLIQTTGRANYREATRDIRRIDPGAPDFEADPEALERFPWALLAAITYWRRRNINRHADRDDIRAVTKAIQGGDGHLERRTAYLAKAKSIWLNAASSLMVHPVLRQGDKGTEVIDLQTELRDAGYRILVDGDFGPNTEEAVRDFQERHGLAVDGVVGPQTWALLLESA